MARTTLAGGTFDAVNTSACLSVNFICVFEAEGNEDGRWLYSTPAAERPNSGPTRIVAGWLWSPS